MRQTGERMGAPCTVLLAIIEHTKSCYSVAVTSAMLSPKMEALVCLCEKGLVYLYLAVLLLSKTLAVKCVVHHFYCFMGLYKKSKIM